MTPTEMLALATDAERLAEKATPGPWCSDGIGLFCEHAIICGPDHLGDLDGLPKVASGNAEFCAAARTGWPACAAALREAAGEIERLRFMPAEVRATVVRPAYPVSDDDVDEVFG